MINKILFFCEGDSSCASVWSNVAYLLSANLENRGIVIVRIDISAPIKWKYFYKNTIYRITHKFYPGNACFFTRSWFYYIYVRRIIRRVVRVHYDADYCFFMGYGFCNSFNKIPSLLLGDWTFEIQINDIYKRTILGNEKRHCRQEEKAINHARIVISLFPRCAEKMKSRYKDANIFYLGKNVVNSLYKGDINADAMLSRKMTSDSILFIGSSHYRDAARMMLSVYMKMKFYNSQLKLNIIGFDSEEFGEIPEGVKCYGYLHKEISDECQKYYELLINAKVLVNPTPNWGGYSSIIEGMFFYTPIIVSPFSDFVQEFGPHITFGKYNSDYNVECICSNLISIFDSPDYRNMCISAHEHVKDYTWSNYVDKLISLL